MSAAAELRDFVVPRDRGREMAGASIKLGLVGLAVAWWLTAPASRQDTAYLSEKANELSAVWADWTLCAAFALALGRNLVRVWRPVTWIAAADRLQVVRSPLGRTSLAPATVEDPNGFANPITGWGDLTRVVAGDDAPLLAGLVVLEVWALVHGVTASPYLADLAVATLLHVLLGAFVVWVLPTVVDRSLLAWQLAQGLRQRELTPTPAHRAPSVDPFWGDSGRAGRALQSAGTETFEIETSDAQ